MVAGGVVSDILPQRSRFVRHVGEVPPDVVVQLLAEAVAIQQVKPQIVADEGVGGVNLGIQSPRGAVVAEVMQERFPEPRVAVRRGDLAEEGVVLAGLGALARQTELSVPPQGVVAEEAGFGHGHLPDGLSQGIGFFRQRAVTVQFPAGFKQQGIQHVGGEGHILHQLVGF